MANTIDRIKVAEEERLISPHASNVSIQDVGTWKPKNTQAAIEQLHTELENKQSTLVNGETIKSINGKSLLGEGNIEIKEEHLIEKTYTPAEFSGLGRKYLQKNIVDVSGTDKNVLTQAMVNDANTIYVIQYDFTLGEDITVPASCVLEFDGGSISGEYTLNGNNTTIEANNYAQIFGTDINIDGSFANDNVSICWFGAKVSSLTGVYFDCTASIQKALDVFPSCGFGTVFIPCGLFYVANSLTMSQYKNIQLEGVSNYVCLKDLVNRNKKDILSTGTIFTDQDIDVLIIDINNTDYGVIANYYIGITIEGGVFDTSLAASFTHSVIRVTDRTNNKVGIHGLCIKTTMLDLIEIGSATGNGIMFDFVNHADIYNIHTDSYIKGYECGILDNTNVAFPTVCMNSYVDNSIIMCGRSIVLKHTERGRLSGVYQAIRVYPTNNQIALIYLDCRDIVVDGEVWDINLSGGGYSTAKYGLEVTNNASKTIVTGRAKSLIYYNLIKGNGYLKDFPALPNYGYRLAESFSYLDNILFDDGSFTYNVELAEGMTCRYEKDLFLSKSNTSGFTVFLGTAQQEEAYCKITVEFAAATYLNCLGILLKSVGTYSPGFNHIKFTIYGNNTLVKEYSGMAESYISQKDIKSIIFPFDTTITGSVNKVEILLNEWDNRFTTPDRDWISIYSIVASVYNASKQQYTKFITTDGRGLSKIYNNSDVVVEDFSKDKYGIARPTGVPNGFCFFDNSLSPARPIWYKGDDTWVDATGTPV